MHDDGSEDATLARRVVAGDAAAEAELFGRLLPRARAWALKRLGDEAAALDLAQQSSMIALEALRDGRVDQLDRMGAFVMGVCRRTLLSIRGGERRRADLFERFGHVFAESTDPLEWTPDRERLQACFEQLPPRARTVIALTFYLDREAAEIADELGVSLGNVRVMRHRALDQLRACMETP